MKPAEFKKRILALSKHIPRAYSPGTLTTRITMVLNKAETPSAARIMVKSGPGQLGDPRRIKLFFSSDTYAQDLASAKFMCFQSWRATLGAFEEEDVKP